MKIMDQDILRKKVCSIDSITDDIAFEIDKLYSWIADLEKDNTKFEHTIEDLKDDIAKLEDQNYELSKENNKLGSKLEDAEELNERLMRNKAFL